jgi:hypothetical protein
VLPASIIRAIASISETSVNFCQTTRRNNPEHRHLHGVSRPSELLCLRNILFHTVCGFVTWWVREIMSLMQSCRSCVSVGPSFTRDLVSDSFQCARTHSSFSFLAAQRQTLVWVDRRNPATQPLTCSSNLWSSFYTLSLPMGNHLTSAMINFYLLTVESAANCLNKSDSNFIKSWNSNTSAIVLF